MWLDITGLGLEKHSDRDINLSFSVQLVIERLKSEEKRDSESRVIPTSNSQLEKGEPAKEIMKEQLEKQKTDEGCVVKQRLQTNAAKRLSKMRTKNILSVQ